jgi:hypothetical protein
MHIVVFEHVCAITVDICIPFACFQATLTACSSKRFRTSCNCKKYSMYTITNSALYYKIRVTSLITCRSLNAVSEHCKVKWNY